MKAASEMASNQYQRIVMKEISVINNVNNQYENGVIWRNNEMASAKEISENKYGVSASISAGVMKYQLWHENVNMGVINVAMSAETQWRRNA
jgi:hypothetical protein